MIKTLSSLFLSSLARVMPLILLTAIAFAQVAGTTSLSTAELRKCLIQRSCQTARDAAYQLARRQDFEFLLRAYKTAEATKKAYIVEAIYGADLGHENLAVVSFMRRVAFDAGSKERLSDTTWYALQFLAEKCNEQALALLRSHGGNADKGYDYHVACSDWAESLKVLGKCRYAAGREVLVNSLNSSCLDVMQAAGDSLDTLYPGQCKNVKTFPEAKRCYSDLWGHENSKQSLGK